MLGEFCEKGKNDNTSSCETFLNTINWKGPDYRGFLYFSRERKVRGMIYWCRGLMGETLTLKNSKVTDFQLHFMANLIRSHVTRAYNFKLYSACIHN